MCVRNSKHEYVLTCKSESNCISTIGADFSVVDFCALFLPPDVILVGLGREAMGALFTYKQSNIWLTCES